VCQICAGTILEKVDDTVPLTISYFSCPLSEKELRAAGRAHLQLCESIDPEIDVTPFGLCGLKFVFDHYRYDARTCGPAFSEDTVTTWDTVWRISSANSLIKSSYERGHPMTAHLSADDIATEPKTGLTKAMADFLHQRSDDLQEKVLGIFDAALGAKFYFRSALQLTLSVVADFLDTELDKCFPGIAKILQSKQSDDADFHRLINRDMNP
jgi:hypothetical protein